MIRVLNNHKRVWVVLLAGGIAAAMMVALLLAEGTKPAHAGAFPGHNGKIAFASNRVTPNNPTGDYEIFSANPDGTGVRQLTFNTSGDYDPAYSPNGKRIAYEGFDGADNEIFTIPASGGASTNVTNNNVNNDSAPSYSPDGKRIAYQAYDGSDYEVFTIPASGGAPTNITNNSTQDYYPTYSPDGKRIAYATTGAPGGSDYEIVTIPVAGGNPFNVTNNSSVDFNPTYSPDGKRIAYQNFEGADNEIFTIPASGGAPTNITNNSTNDTAPAYSPDGKRIAYTGFDDADNEIFTIPASGGERKPVTDNAVSDAGPDWQPNTAPNVSRLHPAPGSTTRDRTPTLSARVKDAQDNLTKADIKLYLDGNRKTFSYNSATDKMAFTANRLSFGKHTAKVVATDASKLTRIKQWSFKVVR